MRRWSNCSSRLLDRKSWKNSFVGGETRNYDPQVSLRVAECPQNVLIIINFGCPIFKLERLQLKLMYQKSIDMIMNVFIKYGGIHGTNNFFRSS